MRSRIFGDLLTILVMPLLGLALGVILVVVLTQAA
jgi:hypothetical protein